MDGLWTVDELWVVHFWQKEWDHTKCGIRWDTGVVMATRRESATCPACREG